MRLFANALAGVDIQRQRLRSAFGHPEMVFGALIVQSAMRWRLGGMPPAISLKDLRAFTEQSALRELEPPRSLDDDRWTEALAWADDVDHGSSLLLVEGTRDRRRCFDGILDQGKPPNDQWQWDFILDRVTVESAEAVGFAAYISDWPQIAERSWTKGYAQRPELGFYLGVLHRQAGREDKAIAAYQAAIDSGHTDAAPRARDALSEHGAPGAVDGTT